MNIFSKKSKKISVKKILESNYGLSINSSKNIIKKNNFSIVNSAKKINVILTKLVSKNSTSFNRFLKLNNAKIMNNIRKQSSWKSNRLKNGLPLNGQRTHTNARTAKKLVPRLSV